MSAMPELKLERMKKLYDETEKQLEYLDNRREGFIAQARQKVNDLRREYGSNAFSHLDWREFLNDEVYNETVALQVSLISSQVTLLDLMMKRIKNDGRDC